MNKFYMGLVLSGIVAMGCTDKDGDTGDTAVEESDTDTDTDTDADPDFTVTWGSTSVDFAMTNLDSGSIGIAETNASCEADTTYGCWTGEDCLYGYTQPDGNGTFDNTSDPYCHGFSGGAMSLAYGASATDVAEGSTTLFPDNGYETLVTYYAEDGAGGCWVWGADTSYYTGLGCTEL